MYVQSYYAGTGAYFFLENMSTGSSHTYGPDTFNGQSGGSAEWIVEKSDSVRLMQWPGALNMNDDEADMNGTWVCAGTQTHVAYQLFAPSELAYPTAWTDPGTYCNFPIYRTSNP